MDMPHVVHEMHLSVEGRIRMLLAQDVAILRRRRRGSLKVGVLVRQPFLPVIVTQVLIIVEGRVRSVV